MNKDEALKLALKFVEDSEGGTADLEAHIKEALAQPEQEPVAWVCHGVLGKLDIDFEEADINKLPIGTLLYTAPAQRTWVGLTDEEISNLWSWSMTLEAELTATTQQHAFARAIEAKLKEKNG